VSLDLLPSFPPKEQGGPVIPPGIGFGVRTESRFHFEVVTLCDSCEVRTESCFHFEVVTLCDSCEVRT
jgi:hypothetical protein